MSNLLGIQHKVLSLKLVKKILICFIFIFVFEFFLFPAPVLASQNDEIANITDNTVIDDPISVDIPPALINNTLPLNSDWQIVKAGSYEITAYNSEVSQCDGSPCITANGFNVCTYGVEDTIAANFLKFGTKVKIPELFGDKIFVVRDRMSGKYQNRVDIWMKNKADALKFGFKYSRIEILEEP